MKMSNAEKKLIKAYFEMLPSINYSKITVSDMIRKAEISRTTFYRHYVDIFDMHKKIADRFACCVIEKCAELVISARSDQDYFEGVLNIFNSQEKYVILISGENGSRYFFEAMIRQSYEYISRVGKNFTEEQLFRIRFVVVAMVGVYVRDILEGREHNPNYIEICKKIVNYKDLPGGSYA